MCGRHLFLLVIRLKSRALISPEKKMKLKSLQQFILIVSKSLDNQMQLPRPFLRLLKQRNIKPLYFCRNKSFDTHSCLVAVMSVYVVSFYLFCSHFTVHFCNKTCVESNLAHVAVITKSRLRSIVQPTNYHHIQQCPSYLLPNNLHVSSKVTNWLQRSIWWS